MLYPILTLLPNATMV